MRSGHLGLTEFTESGVILRVTVYCRERIQIRISQMEKCIEQSLEGFQCQVSVLSPMQSGCVTLLTSLCDNTQRVLSTRKLPHALVFRITIWASLHMHDWWLSTWLNSVFSSADSALPKVPSLSTWLVCLARPALTLTLLSVAIWILRFQGSSFHPKTVAVASLTLKKDIPIRYDADYLPETKAEKGQVSLRAKLNSLLHVRCPERDGKQI